MNLITFAFIGYNLQVCYNACVEWKFVRILSANNAAFHASAWFNLPFFIYTFSPFSLSLLLCSDIIPDAIKKFICHVYVCRTMHTTSFKFSYARYNSHFCIKNYNFPFIFTLVILFMRFCNFHSNFYVIRVEIVMEI